MSKDKKIEVKKIKNIIIFLILFFISFILSKAEILDVKIGTVIIFISYIIININFIDFYFDSKRTKILLYLFLIGNILYFSIASFSLKAILYYLIWMWGISYFVIKNEGKQKVNYVIEYNLIYTIFAILNIAILVFI